jgi:phage antirepressor YoqD-like protein
MTVSIFNYKNNHPVSFFKGMVNATEMSKAFGKTPKDYLRTKSAKDYISFLNSQRADVPSEDNTLSTNTLRVVNGGNHNGTWMCEDLALDFAQWLSLDFRHWVNLRIKELLTTGKTELNNEKQEFNLPKTYIEALKELVTVVEDNEDLKLQVAENKPKVDFFDAAMSSNSAFPIGEIAKILGYKGVGRNKLCAVLREHNILMKNNVPYQSHISSGHFQVVESIFKKSNGMKVVHRKTLVLQKGVNYIMKKLNNLGYEKIIN